MKKMKWFVYCVCFLSAVSFPTRLVAILAGDEFAFPEDKPSFRIDTQGLDSPFNSVGALEIKSGVNNFRGSGVALSGDWVLTAGHNVDVNDDGNVDSALEINFHPPGLDTVAGNGFEIHPDFTGFNRPALNDDLALIELSESLGEGLDYPLYGDALETGDRVTMVGFGRSGFGSNGYTSDASLEKRRTGENVVDTFTDDDEGGGFEEIFRYDFDDADTFGQVNGSLGNDIETIIAPGDSGGPLLKYGGGEYYLAGVNTFTEGSGGRFGDTGGGIVIEPYLDWIMEVTGLNLNSWPASTGGVGQTVLFDENLQSDKSIRVESPRTAGLLIFNNRGIGNAQWQLEGKGSLQMEVVAGQPEIQANTDTSIDVALSGNQGFRKTGSGDLSLSRESDYTGLTRVEGGSLVLYDENALGATGIDNETNIASSASVRLSGQDMKINESFILSGGALDNSTGSNSLIGPINMTANSSIASSRAGEVLRLQGKIVYNDHDLRISGPGNIEISGKSIKQGNGSLRFQGGGHLDISSPTTGEGSTVITGGGTLRTLENGSLANGSLLVSNGSRVELSTNQTSSSIDVSDDASSFIQASGNLSTPLFRNDGFVQIIANTSIDEMKGSGTTNVHGNLKLKNDLFKGTYTGRGIIEKVGPQSWTIEDDSYQAFNGTLNVQSGTVELNSSMAGDFLLQQHAILTGSGIVGGKLYHSGVLQPGNSPGTLTITGDYTPSNTAILEIEIAGTADGQYDFLDIEGAANLNGNGTLNIVLLNGFTPLQDNTDITFLTADSGVSGEFGAVAQSSIYTYDVLYNLTNVTLRYNGVLLTALAQTPNQLSIASALQEEQMSDTRITETFVQLSSEDAIRKSLDSISAEELVSVFTLSRAVVENQNGNLQNRYQTLRRHGSRLDLSSLKLGKNGSRGVSPRPESPYSGAEALQQDESSKWGAFISGSGSFGDTDGRDSQKGERFHTHRITTGIDYELASGFILGAYFTYADAGSRWDNDTGRLDFQTTKIGLYNSLYLDNGLYINASFGIGQGTFDIKRNLIFGNNTRTTKGTAKAIDYETSISAGYDYRTKNFTLNPFVSVDYYRQDLDTYSEFGGGAFNQHFENMTFDSLRSQVGTRLSYEYTAASNEVALIPRMSLSWHNEINDQAYSIQSTLPSGNPVNIHSQAHELNALNFGAGTRAIYQNTHQIGIYYNTNLIQKNQTRHSFSISYDYSW